MNEQESVRSSLRKLEDASRERKAALATKDEISLQRVIPTLLDSVTPLSTCNTLELVESIRRNIADEYSAHHLKPWIIGFSGGKDSTIVAHLVIEHLMSLPPCERKRRVHLVANDTLVESPLVVDHIKLTLNEIGRAALAFNLPVDVALTKPDIEQTFWVNLIGRGYPTPNRSFRWCTDRMKIRPTSNYIRDRISDSEEVILLLGVRRNESATRSMAASRYDNGMRLNRHNDVEGCLVFRPIIELETDHVWEFLAENDPPWGSSHNRLIELYRNANGGDCPVVTSMNDAPSCGSTSPRFGCWTCTVVQKDKSLTGLVDAGFQEFQPLIEFREWLVKIRDDPHRRLARRRNGQVTITKNGYYVPGPFDHSTRREILENLLKLQDDTKMQLIDQMEIELIQQIWNEDLVKTIDRQKCEETHTC